MRRDRTSASRAESAHLRELCESFSLALLHTTTGLPWCQRAVADAVLENIETAMRAGAKPSLEHLCRLLLTADQHDVTGLRDACLAAIAHQFDALAAGAAPSLWSTTGRNCTDARSKDHLPSLQGVDVRRCGYAVICWWVHLQLAPLAAAMPQCWAPSSRQLHPTSARRVFHRPHDVL
jgi:hypothetical protein